MSGQSSFSTTEWAVLALVCEQPTHGWSLVRLLDRDGEIGRVWTVRRALVYRTIERLERDGLIARVRTEHGGRGPRRTIVHATPAGRKAARSWLTEPVERVRDLRSDLLLKLILAARAGVDQTGMLERQRELLADFEHALATGLATAEDEQRALLLGFRLEATRAASRFVDTLLAGRPGPAWPQTAPTRG